MSTKGVVIIMKIYAFSDEADSCIDGQIAALCRNGLEGMEIRGVDGINVSDITVEKAKEVRSKLEESGLMVWSVGSPIGKIDIEKDDYQQHLKKFRHTIAITQVLGAKNIRVFSFYIPAGQPVEQYREEVVLRLREMVSIAAAEGITLCHENEKDIYGDTSQRCLELFKAVPGLRGVFDPANFVQCGEDVLQAWDLLHPYIHYLHIKDALPDGTITPAGEGVGNIPIILKRYIDAGGNNVTLEPHLVVFDGLANLEQEGNTSHVGGYAYASNDAAFDAGCAALKKLL